MGNAIGSSMYSILPDISRGNKCIAFQTKKEWAGHLYKNNWGSDVRARIKERKLAGREPTRGEVDVTEMDIREAFDRGDEVRAKMPRGG